MIYICSSNLIFVLIIILNIICNVEVKECVEDMSQKPKDLKNTRVEVRSLLVRCPSKQDSKDKSKNTRKESLEDREYYCEDFILHPLVTECKKKVFITMKFQNEGKPPCNDEIIIVDHVMDRTTHQRIRLLYPYVFKVKHGHALELYGLKFMHLVNGEAHEQVINKNCKKYLGCDDNPSSVHPTCGFAYNEESVVPYSQGFCCSCDSVVNTHREVPVPVGDPKEDSIKNRRRTISTHSTNHLRLRHHNFSMNNKHKISKHHREKSKEAISNSDDRGEISTVKQAHSHQRRSSKSEPSKGSYSDYRNDNAKFTPGYAEMHDEDYPKELEYAGQRFARHATHKRELISSSEINEAKSTSANITKHQGETSINNRYKREPEKLKEPFRVEIPIPRSVSPIKNEINQWKRKPDEDYFYDNVDSELYDDEKHHRSSKENESLHKRRRDVKSDYGSYSKDRKINEDEEMSKGNYNYRPSRKGKLRAKAKHNKNNDIADLLNYDHARDYDDEESNLVFDQNSQFPSKFPRVSPKSSNSLDYKRLQISKRSKDEGLYEENNEDASEDSIAELHKKHSTVGLKIAQHRGGQNCANKSTPPFADPETYHESAHCLRFSDLWYSVYGLEKPIIDPNMYIHIFERHSCGEENQWVDLTQGKSVRVGPFCPKVTDDTSTYSITYTYCDERNEEDFALDYKTDRLLIPEPVSDENAALYPQLQGGPKEYLVVKKDKISTNGEDCDKAGVSYEAFVKQPNRCHKPKGTCLKNQPIDLWRQDIKARLKGKKGQYFLENFGVLPKDPVKMAGLEREEYISLKFDGKYSSTLDIEINADRNALVEVGVLGRITEVHVDATCAVRTHIYAIITNTGLASSGYIVKLVECGPEGPAEWENQKPVVQKIPPQHVKEFHLALDGELTSGVLLCTVQLLNERQEVLAKRRIRIEKGDRCLCLWHCLCACFAGAEGVQCHPMTTEEYRDAGFRGCLPVPTAPGESTLMHFMFLLATFFVMLLFLGAIKGILGLCCCPLVGAWGLDILVEHPRQIPHYYEEELHGRTVIYDCGGFPVHPDTKLRTVRTISRTTEFCLNLVFFLAFPCAICCALCRRSLIRRDEELGESIDWSNTIIIKEQKGPNCGCSDDQTPLLGNNSCTCGGKRNSSQKPCLLSQQTPEGNEGYQRTSASSGKPPGLNEGYQRRSISSSQKPREEDYPRISTASIGQQVGGIDGTNRRASLRSNMNQPSPSNRLEQPNLLFPPPTEDSEPAQQTLSEQDAVMELVQQLLEAPAVYRTFREPLGNVMVDPDTPYSIRGTFTERDQGYLFVPEEYSKQYWGIVDGDKVGGMENPHYLDPLPLAKLYNTPEEVYNADSLTDFPRSICINVENVGEAVESVRRQ